MRMRYSLIFLTAAGMLASGASAQTTQLYWGDTHLHSSYSVDAYSTGNYNGDPDMAYRFAKGLPVLHPVTREKIRIERPLDFLVVADHAEMLQLQIRLEENDPDILATASGRRLAELLKENKAGVFREVMQISTGGGQDLLRDIYTPFNRSNAWKRQTELAELHNNPGRFTALIGWEWTSAPNWGNLHRVIFTPADAAAAQKFYPYSSYDSQRPEDLWAWLEKTSVEAGVEFVAIPHNSNMSNGIMFDMVDSDGRRITAEYARQRIRWEPVIEVTQTKGNSEVHPQFSPNDEFAGFEVRNRLLTGAESEPSPNSYARSALLQGLDIEAMTGVNPYKFGLIGSTDSHNGLVTTEEGNFFGKLANHMLTEVRKGEQSNFPAWEISASGLAGVWAEENTRTAIVNAFKRKEVYATSGPRIAVRMFGGFNFKSGDASVKDIAAVGYRKGVPMGGDLTAAPRGKAPALLLHAAKDPLGANLDRIQIIKGWLDAAGAKHEQIYDAAWAGERRADGNGKLPPVGNTVDARTATYSNDIGAAQLAAVWTDPDFDPEQRAFYYARVLEIPTPRHSTYDAVALKIDVSETRQPVSLQERAYSSPIWYTPAQ